MSWIDSKNIEECITDASFTSLEKALLNNKYKVTRTKMQITATHGGAWTTNNKISTITIIDMGNYRQCKDVETAKGYFNKPKTGVLARIVQEAENIEQRLPERK